MTPSETQLQQVFEDCVEACADSLYRVAFRLTSNKTLASELVQETYLNAWQNLGSLQDPKKMRSWIFAILRNQYSKLIRKESRAPVTSRLAEPVVTGPEQREEQAGLVQSAIDELDDKHKLPILLVSMEGLSVEEAAGILDLPRGTVLSRLSRGREKLKQILLRKGIEPQPVRK